MNTKAVLEDKFECLVVFSLTLSLQKKQPAGEEGKFI
jgi:hypothetical protein